MRRLTAIALLFILPLHATNLEVIFNVLRYVESNNRQVVGDGGKAYGVVQIHRVCVDDVNRIYGTSYTHADAWNEACAREIFYLYLQSGIDRYKKRYGSNPTELEVVRMWNGGIYQGYKIKQTIRYATKYLQFKKKYGTNNNDSGWYTIPNKRGKQRRRLMYTTDTG